MSDEIKPPRSVKVLGKRIKIKIKELEDSDHGGYSHDDKTIYLSDDEDQMKDRWATLLHEMVHACLTISGVSEVLGIDREEAVCRAIENLAPLLTLRPK